MRVKGEVGEEVLCLHIHVWMDEGTKNSMIQSFRLQHLFFQQINHIVCVMVGLCCLDYSGRTYSQAAEIEMRAMHIVFSHLCKFRRKILIAANEWAENADPRAFTARVCRYTIVEISVEFQLRAYR